MRPLKLENPECFRRIVESWATGAPRKIVAMAGGVSVDTLNEYLRVGRMALEHDQDTIERRLVDAIAEAEPVATEELLKTWRESAREDWRAAERLLIAKEQGSFIRRHEVQLETPEPLKFQEADALQGLSDAEVETLREMARKSVTGGKASGGEAVDS